MNLKIEKVPADTGITVALQAVWIPAPRLSWKRSWRSCCLPPRR